jgi:hypothetical protein
MKRNKRQVVSLCGGCVWLFVVSAAFVFMALAWIATPLSRATLVVVLIGIAICVGFNVRILRDAMRMSGPMPALSSDDRRHLRQFRNVTMAEVAGCSGVSSVCIFTHHLPYLAVANVAVVGLHFMPLARILAMPRYLPMGLLMCVISLVTVADVPPRTMIGDAYAILALPSFLCAVVVIPTALAGVLEARKAIRADEARFISSWPT